MLVTPAPLQLPRELSKDRITCLAFVPADQSMAIGTADRICLLDLSDESVRWSQNWPTDNESIFIDFSPSGEEIAVCLASEQELWVLDTESGEKRYEAAAPQAVSCVRYCPDGTRLATVGESSRVYLHHATTGRRLLTLDGGVLGSGTMTARVIFSPDGRKIAANNWQGKIIVWEATVRASAGSP